MGRIADMRGKAMTTGIILGFAAIAVFLVLAYSPVRMTDFFVRQKGTIVGNSSWEDRGPTPLGEKGYTPQGMTWVDGRIIFANSWKNKRSRVYEYHPESMATTRHFDMPSEAVHTSGLAWDGQYLWAVDFVSNRAYCIDLGPSLEGGEAVVVGSFLTTLKGTSACCIVRWKNDEYLAISDFMRTRQTIFVEHRKALEAGSADGLITYSYRNEGFSQGLEYAEGFLYESENKLGMDVINKISLDKLAESGNSRKATILQFTAPSRGIEDLAWDGQSIWTSDESVFRFYKGRLN